MPLVKTWVDFPLYKMTSPEGDVAYVPNADQVRSIKTLLASMTSSLEEDRPALKAADVKAREFGVELQRKALVAAERLHQGFAKESEKMGFSLARPSYGEYTRAEERARDWVDGQPQVDRSKLAVFGLVGNVQQDGKELSREEIEDLAPAEVYALWGKVESMCFPDSSRIPFWQGRSSP